MKIGDLVQYVDPAIGRSTMPLTLLGFVIDMKVKKSQHSNVSLVHARVQWGNVNQQCQWLPVDYLEVVR